MVICMSDDDVTLSINCLIFAFSETGSPCFSKILVLEHLLELVCELFERHCAFLLIV